jgi:DNA-binding transcriptional ArsR family regulator
MPSVVAHKLPLMYNTHKRFLMSRTSDAVFKAISDPTRRKIIDLLAKSECSVKQITASFDISQPAVSQHLRELRQSKLVISERVGVEQHYRLTAAPLKEVFGWVSRYRTFFDPAGHGWAFTSDANKKAEKHGR